jgi:predicted  nucleic acid-binding Zn-ribbon protein
MKIKPIHQNICIRCGDKFDPYHAKARLCPACNEFRYADTEVARIREQKQYDDRIKSLISIPTHTIEFN